MLEVFLKVFPRVRLKKGHHSTGLMIKPPTSNRSYCTVYWGVSDGKAVIIEERYNNLEIIKNV